MYEYQFPAIPNDWKISKQMLKVIEESQEMQRAADEHEIIMETLDVIHACETLLRKFDKETVDALHESVIEKNEVRGYYNA